jgi:hypothetical protein
MPEYNNILNIFLQVDFNGGDKGGRARAPAPHKYLEKKKKPM